METADSVSLLELGHVTADVLDGTGNVISSISGLIEPVREFPVLGVCAGIHHFDQDFVCLGLGYFRVDNLNLGP